MRSLHGAVEHVVFPDLSRPGTVSDTVALAAIQKFPELDWRWETQQKADWYAAYRHLLEWVERNHG